MNALEAELLVEIGGKLLEGPVWDEAADSVLAVDITDNKLLTVRWDTLAVASVEVQETCSARIPRVRGGHALACRRGLHLSDGDDMGTLAVEIESTRPGNRANEAKCDPGGRMWFGTMADDESDGAGSLYRIDADLTCTRVLEGVTISNGVGWSLDSTRMYYVDSPTRQIDIFDFEASSGTASGRRVLVDVSTLQGVPDGLTVDAEGCMWVAFHGGHAVHRFSADGAHIATVAVPTARPTSCAFAGADMDRLVITTAAGPDDDRGGNLYVCDPGVVGLPVDRFAG